MRSQLLSTSFSLNRRYARSINLERDFDQPDTVAGYVFTERATEALRRILLGMDEAGPDTTAWTLTGVYGTGKSAFAHFLSALFASKESAIHTQAITIIRKTFSSHSNEYKYISQRLCPDGFVRAVVTAQREPLRITLARALQNGILTFDWSVQKPTVLKQVQSWVKGKQAFTNADILDAIQQVAIAAETHVLLIIDELGKILEFAAQTQAAEDLYLLQQVAELGTINGYRTYLFGLLHQSFSDYSQRLTTTERNEWAKIQGRFEDLSFNDSPSQMTRLIGQAIQRTSKTFDKLISRRAIAWDNILHSTASLSDCSADLLNAAYPLHPLTAIVLPMICARYAQSDRSLFTFLTSSEPFSFQRFLSETTGSSKFLPTLKLYQLYDYFVEAVGTGMGSRPNLQRWIEIQTLIADARRLEPNALNLLKTVGILNLITSTGALRATRSLVALAMMETPSDDPQPWQTEIDRLIKQGLLTHRKTLDELRLWEGSDFDVEEAITTYLEQERSPLAQLLSTVAPLPPLIAQRHSYHTGTLRYFERHYCDQLHQLDAITVHPDRDGVILYWVGDGSLHRVPHQTQDGKPLLVLEAQYLSRLRDRTLEFAALYHIQTHAAPLQGDGVARREVGHRLVHARRLVDEALAHAFDVRRGHPCWVGGEHGAIATAQQFNAMLSTVCDRAYHRSPVLWNELINRRVLTSQGAKARRLLIEAMLEQGDQERLGLEGYGPEVSMYYSVLAESQIHRCEYSQWGFYPPSSQPNQKSYLTSIWEAIDRVCQATTTHPQSIADLYGVLEAPPYGMKQGAIPILLAAYLLHHVDDISVYKDSTFIPVLGSEHFELLVKAPERFAVKSIAVAGLRSQVFKALEDILRRKPITQTGRIRNATVLSVVKPLFQFVRKLPPYTTKTEHLSPEARQVIRTLLKAQEPDELLFVSLPQACGLEPIPADQKNNDAIAQQFKQTLVKILQEIQSAYEVLLSDCQHLLHEAFDIPTQPATLREILRSRARLLEGHVVERLLNRVVIAAIDETKSDRAWLEALIMIVADKPAESWSDRDRTQFELNLGDVARRFQRLEVLRMEMQHTPSDAQLVTISRSDGREVKHVVWLNPEKMRSVDETITQRLADLTKDELQTLHARLTQQLYDDEQPSTLSASKPARRTRKRTQKSS
jgi:hypothetical protein